MKKNIFTIAALLTATVLSSCGTKSQINKDVKLAKDIDSASYAIGVNIGSSLVENLNDLNKEAFFAGFAAAFDKDSANIIIKADTCPNIIRSFMQARAEVEAKKNLEEGNKFLQENGKKEGVVTTASGLQYKVIKNGEGKETPKPEDKVEVNYTGKVIDGTVFDATEKHGGQPAQFGVNQVIRGWQEGLQLMTVGSKYEFYIPAELAYGQGSPTPVIKPNSVLIFEVELLQIMKAEAAPQANPQPQK